MRSRMRMRRGRAIVSGGAGSLSVTWYPGDVAGVTGYNVYYQLDTADELDLTAWVLAGNTAETGAASYTRTITGLAVATLYRVDVRAVNAVGEAASIPVEITAT